jgi:hypothetical protein
MEKTTTYTVWRRSDGYVDASAGEKPRGVLGTNTYRVQVLHTNRNRSAGSTPDTLGPYDTYLVDKRSRADR